MALDQQHHVYAQLSAAHRTGSAEPDSWLGGNVLTESSPAVFSPRARIRDTEVAPLIDNDDLWVSSADGTLSATLKDFAFTDGERHQWWKMAAWNLRVITPLLLSDVLFISTILAVASYLASSYAGAAASPSFAVMGCVLLALIVGRHAEGLYPGVGLNVVVELRKQTIATTVVMIVIALSWFAMGQFHPELAFFLVPVYLACLIVLPICRCLSQILLGKTSWWGFPVLIFGCGPAARRVLSAIRNSPSRGFRPAGCVGIPSELLRDHRGMGSPVSADDLLGTFEEAPELIERHQVQWVIGAMPETSPEEVARLVSLYAARAPHRLLTTGISDFPYLWQIVRDCGGQAGIEIRDGLLMPSRQVFKRAFDICAVLIGGLLISPVLLAIAFAIKLSSPGPVFYGQKRIGYAGKELTIWKFRSMFVNADTVLREYLANDAGLRTEWERTHKLRKDPRITRIGRFLRTTSLDELPQLWNILRGEMSLVGPRPIVDDLNYDREYVTDYPEAYQLYLRVRPGITGLWQVAGRRHRDYYLRPQLDAYYVRNWSIWLDLFLLTRTVKTVLRREGSC